MKKPLFLFIVCALLVGACAPASVVSTPTATPIPPHPTPTQLVPLPEPTATIDDPAYLDMPWIDREPKSLPTSTPSPPRSREEWERVWQEQGREETAAKVVSLCLRHIPLVEQWNPYFDLPVDVVLSVMAAESGCNPYIPDSYARAVGLMQVIPEAWTTTRDRLRDPAINVYWGMFILDGALHSTKNTDGMRMALAAYNCGWYSVLRSRCVAGGGYDYADDVLGFWLPRVQATMTSSSTY